MSAAPASAAAVADPGRPVIVVDNVSKRFGGKLAVENLSLTVRRGEIVAILGRTGAGKSTALHMIMGAFPPDQGAVSVEGLDPYRQFRALRGRLAVSFQTDRLLPWRSAADNVALGLQILGQPAEERRRAARRWLEAVKIVGEDNAAKYPHQLSGGMRQRVSLARALAVDPALVLLDESFSQLDHVTSAELRADFAELARRLNKTCVLITHRIDDALDMADRILVLAAPARLVLEVAVTADTRQDAAWRQRQHDAIANAMGGGQT
jgi:NitT/TauT family transport system ATP-binding protein